jgi:RING-like zinc finger
VAMVFVRHPISTCLAVPSWQPRVCLHRPILTFLTILFIPSSLTFLTLVIHRIRAAHAAQRERAPEDVVKNLPWCVWTGSGWEKHEGVTPDKGVDQGVIPVAVSDDVELGQTPVPNPTTSAQTSEDEDPAWFNSQVQCAICLDEFVKGDRVRVLPCKHIFHLDEVDEWLIQLKKLVRPMAIGLRSCRCLTPHASLVSYLQGRCDLPSASRPPRPYRHFSRSASGCFATITVVQPLGADTPAAGPNQSPGGSRLVIFILPIPLYQWI